MTLPPDDPRHGTENGYGNLRCRCAACRAAHAKYHLKGAYNMNTCQCGAAKWKGAARCRKCRDATVAAPHGTESRHQGGCKCGDCVRAATKARKDRRHRQEQRERQAA